MYIIYIDESGTPHFTEMTSDFHLAAMIIKEHDYSEINKKFNEIKLKYFKKDEIDHVELHASDIISRKGMFRAISRNEVWDLFTDVYNLISEIDCCLIASIIRKKEIYPNRKKDFDIQLWGYRLLIERIWKWFEKANLNSTDINYGILCIDSINSKKDDELRNKLRRFQNNGTYYQSNEFLIEDPFFVKSHFRNMSQLVDLVAYCVMKKHKLTKTAKDKKFDPYFELIKPKFDTDEKGKLYGCGIKIFPDRRE